MGFRMLRSAAAVLAVLLLAGCVPGEPVVTPEPDPDVTPVFASDEEALAAATEAYAKYLEVADSIRADGGNNPDRVSAVVTPDRVAEELDGFAYFSDNEVSTVGSIELADIELQQYFDLDEKAEVTIYACQDASSIRFVDSSGVDVTPTEKPGRQMFEVVLRSSGDDPRRLLLAGSELWEQTDEC